MNRQGPTPAATAIATLALLLGGCTNEPPDTLVLRPEAPPASAEAEPGSASPSPSAAHPEPFTWTGCDISKKAYLLEAAAAYREETGVEMIVTGGGATRGIRATAGGRSDLGGSCRACLPTDYPEEAGVVLVHVAWDALVFFTHPGNPVSSITSEQARGILTGDIVNWEQLGGPPARIKPALRRQTVQGKLSGVGYMTRLLLFQDTAVDYTEEAVFHVSSGPIERFVESTPFSFGVTGVSSARKLKVKILALDGVEPTKEGILSGHYPLTRPLYLVAPRDPTGQTRAFLEWIVGPSGQRLIAETGTVNLEEGQGLAPRFHHWPDPSLLWAP
ncbi:MAG: substrate-binding domain-containing protein [Planctomycetota bacterium]|jgi:phosphate transport system substrate-binding protein